MATKKKKKAAKTKTAKKKTAKKSATSRPRAKSSMSGGRKTAIRKAAVAGKRPRGKVEAVDVVSFEPTGLGARSGGQSGDLQGLSRAGRSSSESVDELLEEGNAFEAGVVRGVEDAADADEAEVRTHEVPEDDVPEEYRDKD